MDQKLIDQVREGKATCIAAGDGKEYEASGMGVKPIIGPMRQDREFFRGMQVADTVIGKAAALLLALSGAAEVYGGVMSRQAAAVLEANKIPYRYGTMVEFIQNRTGDGMCPLEMSVQEEDDPACAFGKIEARIAELMAAKG